MPAEVHGAVLAGRYRVLRPLGSGGMATVFLCVDERLGREVAVKRMHSASPEDGARRFAREARLGAGLNHENLVTIYDTVADGEGVLIVMEHVSGGTLRDALRGGPLPPAEVVRIVRDVAAGLDHAHAHGVIHRDVKPANVLLRDDGVAKVVDLGIAIARDETRITVSGTVLGTGAYMAPEQLEGDLATPATDVYALAAVAYEALTGRRARTGKSALEIAHQLATEPPPDLAAVRPDLPAAVAETLRRGLDRDARRRQPSAGALARELEAGLSEPQTRRLPTPPRDSPGAAPPSSVARRTSRPPSASRLAGPASRGAEPPSSATRRSGRNGGVDRDVSRRRRGLGLALAAVVALAAVAVVAVVLLSGGDTPSEGGASVAQRPEPARTGGGDAEAAPPAKAPATEEPPAEEPPADDAPADEAPDPEKKPARKAPPAKPAPQPPGAYTVPEPAGTDPGRAAQLNANGYALLQAGRFAEAIPQLEEAVRLSPPGTVDPYGYALFNLGSALRQAGRSADAIPVLERRLEIPNQRGIVRRELDLARAG